MTTVPGTALGTAPGTTTVSAPGTTAVLAPGSPPGAPAARPPYAVPGLGDMARALADGSVSSRWLTEQCLERIEASQPELNAFRIVHAEAALAEADAADRRLAAGERLPLLGVPLAVKDDMDVAGLPTAFGCAGDFPPKAEDSEAVRRLRAAGAVIVGKTQTPELGQWPHTEGPAFGETRNPWNPAFTPGGSSGGSAAAVAAGLIPAALGSDGAGSIRIPAAWTHLVGIKPQRGRISTWPEPEAFRGLTVNGVLARTVADAALLLDAASGSHPGDLHRPAPVSAARAARTAPGRLRIALSFGMPFTGTSKSLDPAIRYAVERLAGRLEALGHEVALEDPRYGKIGLSFIPRATGGVHEWAARVPDPSLLDPRTSEATLMGRILSGLPLRAARRAEALHQHRIGEIFQRFDVVLTPTTATAPLRVGALAGRGVLETDRVIIAACPYAWPWNVLGWPGVNVPAGFTPQGLPVGAQLLGPEASEPLLISLAAQLEAAENWQSHWPRWSAPLRAGTETSPAHHPVGAR
ncbi:amidase [Streptomyces sp. NBC_00536]|uniref:amidase n=1 Tax=Streptomyces sp. NBC_00536 TaxID=2975769 RepID=UPI002E814B0A|nr:amidase [Streptomyces sp. NBC_00536]WUC82544.1 amidase [Streptomyces sp. NBC_00536]